MALVFITDWSPPLEAQITFSQLSTVCFCFWDSASVVGDLDRMSELILRLAPGPEDESPYEALCEATSCLSLDSLTSGKSSDRDSGRPESEAGKVSLQKRSLTHEFPLGGGSGPLAMAMYHSLSLMIIHRRIEHSIPHMLVQVMKKRWAQRWMKKCKAHCILTPSLSCLCLYCRPVILTTVLMRDVSWWKRRKITHMSYFWPHKPKSLHPSPSLIPENVSVCSPVILLSYQYSFIFVGYFQDVWKHWLVNQAHQSCLTFTRARYEKYLLWLFLWTASAYYQVKLEAFGSLSLDALQTSPSAFQHNQHHSYYLETSGSGRWSLINQCRPRFIPLFG